MLVSRQHPRVGHSHNSSIMKKEMLFLLLCMSSVAYSQDSKKILGLWQAGTASVTSMYFDTYKFSENGRFSFEPDQYDGLNRVISIVGKYTIKHDTLFLTPDSTRELIGGYPERSKVTTLSDSWEITNGIVKMLACKKKIRNTIKIKLFESADSLILDDSKFYKVE